jgi:hypothetical protein
VSSREETKKTEEKPYVLKVLNQLESQRTKLLNLTSKVLLFLNERGPGRGVECPVPQPSVFGTDIVWCRIPRKRSQNENKNCEFNETWSPKEHEIQLVLNAGCGSNYIPCGGDSFYSQSHFSSVSTVDDGDVCAVRLFSYIPGDLLCDVKWTTELLVDLGTKIGNMHKIFKVNCVYILPVYAFTPILAFSIRSVVCFNLELTYFNKALTKNKISFKLKHLI